MKMDGSSTLNVFSPLAVISSSGPSHQANRILCFIFGGADANSR